MAFKRSALNNLSFSAELNENFICTYKQVSSFRVESQTPKNHKLRKAKKRPSADDPNVRKSGGDIVSYFCDSSGRVVEVFAGRGGQIGLLEAAKRVAQFNTALVSAPANDHSDLARAYIRDLINDKVEKDFDDYAASYSDNKSNDEPALRKFLAAKPFPNGRTASEFLLERKIVANRFREKFLLWRNPLPQIGDIEKPVFECLTGNEYKVPSPEFYRRLQQFSDANKSGKFVLAVMLDDRINPRSHLRASQDSKFVAANVDHIASYGGIKRKLEQFEIVDVTHDDLFRILSELGKEPMQFKTTRTIDKRGIGYILFDRDAKVVKFLPPDTKLPDLSRALKLAANK